ncbi:MAG: hypothetical protein R3A10_21250 [Caldilineaceae bacterium]
MRVLATEDINADEQADVVWVDTNCGASTCFDTVKIYSWTGQRWTNWAEDNMTMAYADVTITDSSEEGQGREIVLDGGVYGSVGAGPQRSRTETRGRRTAHHALLGSVRPEQLPLSRGARRQPRLRCRTPSRLWHG